MWGIQNKDWLAKPTEKNERENISNKIKNSKIVQTKNNRNKMGSLTTFLKILSQFQKQLKTTWTLAIGWLNINENHVTENTEMILVYISLWMTKI